MRPHVVGARLAAWLGHFDFFAASADDAFSRGDVAPRAERCAAIGGVIAGRGNGWPRTDRPARLDCGVHQFSRSGGLFAARAAVFCRRRLRAKCCQMAGMWNAAPARILLPCATLIEMRSLLHLANAQAPAALGGAIERLALALRTLRHGDGSLALFNGTRDESPALIELILAQSGRYGAWWAGRFAEHGFSTLAGGRDDADRGRRARRPRPGWTGWRMRGR